MVQQEDKFMKRLQKPMFTQQLIAKQDGEKMSKLLNEELKFGCNYRKFVEHLMSLPSQSSQRTTRVTMVF